MLLELMVTKQKHIIKKQPTCFKIAHTAVTHDGTLKTSTERTSSPTKLDLTSQRLRKKISTLDSPDNEDAMHPDSTLPPPCKLQPTREIWTPNLKTALWQLHLILVYSFLHQTPNCLTLLVGDALKYESKAT